MRDLHRSAYWLIPLCLMANLSLAVEPAKTTLVGKVEEIKDPPAGLFGVQVTVRDGSGKVLAARALTDPNGMYRIPDLPAGVAVSVEYERNGYEESPTIVESVQLVEDRTAMPTVNMIMGQGDAQYYSGVAKEIGRRISARPAEEKKLIHLIEELDVEERGVVLDHLKRDNFKTEVDKLDTLDLGESEKSEVIRKIRPKSTRVPTKPAYRPPL